MKSEVVAKILLEKYLLYLCRALKSMGRGKITRSAGVLLRILATTTTCSFITYQRINILTSGKNASAKLSVTFLVCILHRRNYGLP